MTATLISESLYQDIIRARVQSAIEMARVVKAMPHRRTRGEIREILVRELFRPFLPSDIGVGTGQVIDHTGKVSRQTDIILFDRSLAPPIMLNESLGLFPIESCLYVIEIKSVLNLDELRESHKNALALEALSYTNQRGQYAWTRYLLFAFASDLVDSEKAKHRNECSRYQELYEEDSSCRKYASGKPDPPIRALCVVGKEYGQEDNGKWEGVVSDNACKEVLVFIGGVINTYRSIAATRRPIRAEDYVFPQHTDFQPLSPSD
jgi:hypothetical protein